MTEIESDRERGRKTEVMTRITATIEAMCGLSSHKRWGNGANERDDGGTET